MAGGASLVPAPAGPRDTDGSGGAVRSVARWGDTGRGYLYLAPVFAVLGLVVGWPLFEAARMSVHDVYLLSGRTQETFIGLENFRTFGRDANAPTYLLNTAIFVLGGMGGQFAVALLLAVLLSRRVTFAAFWRGLAIIPWAMPITVTALVWRWILNGQWGILNYVLYELGVVSEYVSWLSSQTWMWPSILIVNVWAGFPFMFVNLLSGLQGISPELYEAAQIDGAGPLRTFVRITLPLLRPVIAALLLLSTVVHLRDFATVWILTSGGPGIRSTTLSQLVYITSFRYFRMSYGAAIGIILMSFSLLFTVLYLRRVRFEV